MWLLSFLREAYGPYRLGSPSAIPHIFIPLSDKYLKNQGLTISIYKQSNNEHEANIALYIFCIARVALLEIN